MTTPKTKKFEIVQDMPPELANRLECSMSLEQLRIAADHHVIYNALVDNAWADIQAAVDWFSSQKRYSEGVDWLENNVPKIFPAAVAIISLKAADKKEKDNELPN